MCFSRKWRLMGLLFCAGVCGATQFPYSITCQAVTVGPDTIDAYTQSGTIDLTPNVPNSSNTIDFFNANTDVFNANALFTFTSTLACTFTLAGVTTQVNRSVQVVVEVPNFGRPFHHSFIFQPFSFIVGIPSQGSVSVSQGTRTTTLTISAPNPPTFVTPPASSTLLFTPLQPNGLPLPPSLVLILTGLAGAGLYQVQRHYRRHD